ncbi:MAG: alpha-L-arabinofuranosidase [Verrucomicrobia bacterium]|nr:MAG: alpha-L-arabinofuranosidase [Verrucomicrobiota bacterium]
MPTYHSINHHNPMSKPYNRTGMKNTATWTATVLLACAAAVAAQGTITVGVDKPGVRVSPTLWGIFFEDINLSADGGLYAELVRNRSFEDSDQAESWVIKAGGTAKAEMTVVADQPVSATNPHSLKVTVSGSGSAGVANSGYYGMSVVQGDTYILTLDARAGTDFTGPLTVTLEAADGTVCAAGQIAGLTPAWQPYKLSLKAAATDTKARLVITAGKPGTLWLDMVSLIPEKTWKGHGFRSDLFEMLVALKPAFVRFPGGCWVEGDTMKEAYRWKQTIGDIAERRTQNNIWGYKATHGIGYHEYLVMCEDLNSEPLFDINCGMSHRENVPIDQMQEYVQDALDAIEYANGPANSTWGALRAKAGHPAPFHLKMMEIGNENGGAAYNERYALFHDAIKAKYPDMQLIANVWGGMPSNREIGIVDEHYYSNPEFFIGNSSKYDSYDRGKFKVFVGEYAVTEGTGQGSLRGAVGEAAFMTGMERNSDVVALASYAPLFVNINHKRWNPDLINFDSSRAYGIPSYYVQKMFAENRGAVVLPVEVQTSDTIDAIIGMVGVGTWNTQAEYKDIKVQRGNETLLKCDFVDGTKGWDLHGGEWKVHDGVLGQTASGKDFRAVIGDPAWSDYTYTLKARKTGGDEGFLVIFGTDGSTSKSWWNIGSWGNSKHTIEMAGGNSQGVDGHIETGRWYDIKVEVMGSGVKCYLDGKLVQEMHRPAVRSLHVSSTLSSDGKDIILKVVNASSANQATAIKLNGAKNIAASAKVIVLTSVNSSDENSITEPAKVVPVASEISNAAASFTHTFPPNSVSVLRIRKN